MEFIDIGVLIVVLGGGGSLMMYLAHKYLRPYLNQKHIQQLEEENRRLDELLGRGLNISQHIRSTDKR